MPPISLNRRFRFLTTAVVFLATLALAASVSAHIPEVRHDLTVTLHPERHLLVGLDELTVKGPGDVFTAALASHAAVDRVSVNGAGVDFRFRNGRLSVPLPEAGDASVRVQIAYSAKFTDPFPETPVNTDNPGYGVTGIVSPKGTFLLAGSGWYPHVAADRTAFRLRVDAPEGIAAVTAGRSMGRETRNGRTVSQWDIGRSAEAIALSAGPYVIAERDLGGLSIATYFLQETQPLSGDYLDAVERYIRLYEGLFGPYPFEKFAVVENFFPTGYGFPSYTLMGGRVLRLPFIIHTSLGHEIAHCWWGNGVRVDYSGGNWSEGLTAYVADHLYQEQKSEARAREHRRQWLRNYATLVDAGSDFPLVEFTGRYDRPTKVIGYDKGAMLFHMVRRRLGEDAFWGALRDVFRDRLFRSATWRDFQDAFERRAGCTDACLAPVFDQWVQRKGAPVLALQGVKRHRGPDGRWVVTGRIVQETPVYTLRLPLAVETADGRVVESIGLDGSGADFTVRTDAPPLAIELDPHADVFRRLYPEEIPPAVNTIKGAGAVLVVVADSAGDRGQEIGALLVRSLGLRNAAWIRESDLDPNRLASADLLFVGFPRDATLLAGIPDTVAADPTGFSLADTAYDNPGDALFAVFPHPTNPEQRTAGLFYAPGTVPDARTTMKITHYGRYSYLAFRGGRNTAKGVWPVTASPLIVRWATGDKDRS